MLLDFHWWIITHLKHLQCHTAHVEMTPSPFSVFVVMKDPNVAVQQALYGLWTIMDLAGWMIWCLICTLQDIDGME